MNRARIILLGVAFAAAGGAAFLVRTMTETGAPAPAPIVEVKKEVDVLVAARQLEIGTTLGPGDVRWQTWPENGATANFITKRAAPDAIERAAGATVRTPIGMGEPVTKLKIVQAGDAGFMAAMLTPGMRAISLRINEETGAGGFILPNDKVDVIMTREVQDDSGLGNNGHETQTILQNVRVLAIGQTFQGTGEEKTAQGKTATLEVAPVHAELLALAGAMGDLTLALRSVAHGGITAALPPDLSFLGRSGAEDGTIRVIRYARPSRVVPMANKNQSARSHE